MYNSSMNVVINGPERAIKAGTWAEQNLKHRWGLDVKEPFSNEFCFTFSNPQEASLFALKWVQ